VLRDHSGIRQSRLCTLLSLTYNNSDFYWELKLYLLYQVNRRINREPKLRSKRCVRVIVRDISIDRCVSQSASECVSWIALGLDVISLILPSRNVNWVNGPWVRVQRKYELCISTVSHSVITVNHVGKFDRCVRSRSSVILERNHSSSRLMDSCTIENGKMNCANDFWRDSVQIAWVLFLRNYTDDVYFIFSWCE